MEVKYGRFEPQRKTSWEDVASETISNFRTSSSIGTDQGENTGATATATNSLSHFVHATICGTSARYSRTDWIYDQLFWASTSYLQFRLWGRWNAFSTECFSVVYTQQSAEYVKQKYSFQ